MFYNEYCWSFKKKAVILQVIKIKYEKNCNIFNINACFLRGDIIGKNNAGGLDRYARLHHDVSNQKYAYRIG